MMGIIACAIGVYVGVSNIIENAKVADEKLLEQCVYESLQRTKNPKYVEYLTIMYAANKIKRTYHPFKNRESFMEQYKYFEKRDSYNGNIECFDELVNLIDENFEFEESTSPQSNDYI